MKFLNTNAFLNGAWVSADETFPVFDPSTGDVVAQVARATEALTRQAIDAAAAALPASRSTPSIARRKPIPANKV